MTNTLLSIGGNAALADNAPSVWKASGGRVLKQCWIGLVLLMLGCSQPPQTQTLVGTDITGASLSGKFTLTDHMGQVRHLEDFKGKVVAVFFGYTRCPDVCPTTMMSLASAMKVLGDKAKEVQVLFITVDPERDTEEILAQYVPSFDPSFIGLVGTQAQLKEATRNYRAVYRKQPTADGSSYTMDHSAGVYVFDRKGEIRAFLRHDQTPAELAHDITHFY